MFGDLDWPLNASCSLSAIAEFLVCPSGGHDWLPVLHCTYPWKGRPGWVVLGGWLHSKVVYLPKGRHTSQYWLGSVYSNFGEQDQCITTVPDRLPKDVISSSKMLNLDWL